jgi:hypothetical protein
MKKIWFFITIFMSVLALGCIPSVGAATVHIVNGSFLPSIVIVQPGEGVTWINDDSFPHSVVSSGNHFGMFASGGIVSGGSWGYTVTGDTFDYSEGSNTGMTGRVIVETKGVQNAVPVTTIQTPAPAMTPQGVVAKPTVTKVTAIPTTEPTKKVVVTEAITTTPTPRPTATINYSATIAAMQSQIAEQNVKIERQGGWLEKILKFLGLA